MAEGLRAPDWLMLGVEVLGPGGARGVVEGFTLTTDGERMAGSVKLALYTDRCVRSTVSVEAPEFLRAWRPNNPRKDAYDLLELDDA